MRPRTAACEATHARARGWRPFQAHGTRELRRGWVWALMLLVGCQSPTPSVESADTVLWDVTLIDGTGAPPAPHRVLVLRDGRIAAIGGVGETPLRSGSRVVDLRGRSVVPGLIDLHVHFPRDEAVQDAILDRLLDHGITTVFNPGARPGADVELRERAALREDPAPRLFTAGPILDCAPRDREPTSWFVYVSEEEELVEAVRQQAARGVDWIKLYEHLPPAFVRAGIQEAHAQGLPVVVHAGATTWGEAARMGADMLVHSGYGTPMEELIELEDPDSASNEVWYRAYADAPSGRAFAELAQALVEEGVIVVPTLSITQAAGLGFDTRLLPGFRTELAPGVELADWWTPGWRERHPQTGELDVGEERLLEEVYFPGVLGIVRAYFERGVQLGVGTDVGNSWMTPGVVYHHELELYQRAGLPPLEILAMATRNGAAALGILDDVGTLEPGKRADLVVLTRSPAQDIRSMAEIEAVYLGGQLVREAR